MKLRYAPPSPFVRKVMVVAIEGGIESRIEKIPTAVVPVTPNDQLKAENRSSKCPRSPPMTASCSTIRR